MRYGSVCSGIEAATVAWEPLGWKPAFFSEIERFPSSVLRHHYPDVPNAGDFTGIENGQYEPIELLVGGTPCQDFSVAGLRAGMDGARGNLTLEFLRLADRLRPRWLVWENVPGVLSSTSHGAPDPSPPEDPLDMECDGQEMDTEDDYDAVELHAFNSFLAGLSELGYGFAYRVLDAQHLGVPQRRRRVFVVGHLGDWRRAAAVLFERHSLSGHPPPRRETGQVAPTIPARSLGGGGLGTDFDCDGGLIASTGHISHCLNAGGMGRQDYETETLITHSLQGEGFDASEDGTGRGTPLGPIAIQGAAHRENSASGPDGVGVRTDGVAYTLEARAEVQAVAFRTSPNCGAWETGNRTDAITTSTDPTSHILAISANQRGEVRTRQVHGSLSASKSGKQFDGVIQKMAVRRLTPRECERLQGFPDDYTRISAKTADGPRYKALGNSFAVPVVRWIGERIQMVEETYK